MGKYTSPHTKRPQLILPKWNNIWPEMSKSHFPSKMLPEMGAQVALKSTQAIAKSFWWTPLLKICWICLSPVRFYKSASWFLLGPWRWSKHLLGPRPRIYAENTWTYYEYEIYVFDTHHTKRKPWFFSDSEANSSKRLQRSGNTSASASSSWWFQPIWKRLVKLDHFPR